MKYILLTVSILLHSFLFAQQTKTITAKPDKVTVYLQGAHIYYSENISLQKGVNEFAFENISPYINPTSIQAIANSGLVMDMKYETIYEEVTPDLKAVKKYEKELQQVADSLEALGYDIKDVDNKLKVLATEKNLLLNNRIMKGEILKDSLPLLKDGLAFLKEKLNNIYAEELKYEKAKNKLNTEKSRLEKRRNDLLLLQNGNGSNNTGAKQINRIVISVFSEGFATAKLDFSYYVNNASWMPVYDLQASSKDNNLKFVYYAQVSQSSGLDWKNIPLTLSTATPLQNNTKPTLSPWYLSFFVYRQNQDMMSNSTRPLNKETISFESNDDFSPNADLKMKDYISVSENLLRVEYEIKLSYTINSDGKTHRVLINDKSVPMGLQFAAIPKLGSDGYLMAKITDWEDMNIIPGNARIYFDGSFVGDMYLNTTSVEDTLKINLGRDRTFATTRKKVKEKTKNQLIGDDRIETRTIEIIVRNTKNQNIDVEVEDQIPVAMGTDEIKVILKDSDNAELNEATGSLKWNLTLKPKETKKLKFTYEIRYPKNKKVVGL